MYRNGEREQAKSMLEPVAESGTGIYQARALLSLGTLEAAKQDFASEARYYLEAFKASRDINTKVEAARGRAVIKAKEGFHKSSVKDFEKFLPLAINSDALTYNLYISSLAVELGEIGRTDETRNISRIVLASPFALQYPEWQETARDLKEPNRSSVAVSSIQLKHAEIETTVTHHVSQPEQPARVVSFPPLKEAPPPKKPERLRPREVNELTASEKRELILAAIRTSPMPEGDYNKLMVMVGLLRSGPADKILDLEDEALLDDIIVVWSNQAGRISRCTVCLARLRR